MAHRIARAGLGDVSLVAQLFDMYRIFYGKATDIDGAMKFVGDRIASDESVVYLALEGYGPRAKGLGFVQLFPAWSSVWMRRTWILNDLFVHPDARRRGIARELLKTAAAFGKGDGAKRLELSTAVDNVAAKALYESMGWVRTTAFDEYKLELG